MVGLLFSFASCKKAEDISGSGASGVMSGAPKTPTLGDFDKWDISSDLVQIASRSHSRGWNFQKNQAVSVNTCHEDTCDLVCTFGFGKSRSAGVTELQSTMGFGCDGPLWEISGCFVSFYKTKNNGQWMFRVRTHSSGADRDQILAANSIPFTAKGFAEWLSGNYFKACANVIAADSEPEHKVDAVTGYYTNSRTGAHVNLASLIQQAITEQVVQPK